MIFIDAEEMTVPNVHCILITSKGAAVENKFGISLQIPDVP